MVDFPSFLPCAPINNASRGDADVSLSPSQTSESRDDAAHENKRRKMCVNINNARRWVKIEKCILVCVPWADGRA